MIFQGLGARYSLVGAIKHLFAFGNDQDRHQLAEILFQKYGGRVTLYRRGRTALAEAIRLASGGSGKVAISGLTCYNVVQAVESAGCRPVFVDIRRQDLHFGVDELTQRLKNHPDIKAVIVQNMLGYPADIAGIEALAKQYNIPIIEDLAHSAGTHYPDGREVGTVGDLTMLSFGRDKAIDASGGGALIVREPKLGKAVEPSVNPPLLEQLRDRLYPIIAWLSRKLYQIRIGRYLMSASIRWRLVARSADGQPDSGQKLPSWQAKLANQQIARLDDMVAHRHHLAKLYQQKLGDLTMFDELPAGASPLRVPIEVDHRQQILRRLMAQGIQIYDTWYDSPVAPTRFYRQVDFPEVDNPVATSIAKRLINLPTHQQISEQDIDRLVKQLQVEVADAKN